VTVDGDVVSEFSRQGLVVFVGVTSDDDAGKARRLAAKLHELRILDEEQSASDVDAPLMVISQFTLYGDASRGRRPSWSAAARSSIAEPLFDEVVNELRRRGASVTTGLFGAHMQVQLVNDGPVTLILEI
jgi:D-aminoacyl-tRNA deacylase